MRDKMRYQVCEIINGDLKHYYKSPRQNIAWMSRHRASRLTLEEAREILANYSKIDPERDLFIQSEYDCHFRETDKYGVILPQERKAS